MSMFRKLNLVSSGYGYNSLFYSVHARELELKYSRINCVQFVSDKLILLASMWYICDDVKGYVYVYSYNKFDIVWNLKFCHV